jgi:hypothetical protein
VSEYIYAISTWSQPQLVENTLSFSGSFTCGINGGSVCAGGVFSVANFGGNEGVLITFSPAPNQMFSNSIATDATGAGSNNNLYTSGAICSPGQYVTAYANDASGLPQASTTLQCS